MDQLQINYIFHGKGQSLVYFSNQNGNSLCTRHQYAKSSVAVKTQLAISCERAVYVADEDQ